MKIKNKLISILLVSVIPLVGISIFSINNFTTEITNQINKTCTSIAQQTQLQISLYIKEPVQTMKTLSILPSVVNFDSSIVKPTLAEAIKNKSGINYVVDDALGMQVIRGDNLKNSNIAERDYYKGAMAGNEESYQVLVSKGTGILSVNMGVPIRKENTIVGVVQASQPLTYITNYVKLLSVNGQLVYVLDNKGIVLAHPDNKIVKDRTDMSKVDYIAKALKDKKSGSTMLKGTKTGTRLITYSYDKVTGWLICIDYPYDTAMASTRNLTTIFYLTTLAVLIVVLTLVFFISRSITKPINHLQENADKIANGDLSDVKFENKSKDELGKLATVFILMTENLITLITSIKESSSQVEDASMELGESCNQSLIASNQVALKMQEISVDSEESVKGIDKTNDSINNLLDAFNLVNKKFSSMVNTVEKTSQYSLSGKISIDKANVQMNNIQYTVNELSDVVTKLSVNYISINDFVDVISSIAEQTNLLALNAAIEAARAGEQGRGFAVVAEEVTKLAGESNKAAQEIKDLIAVIQSETKNATFSMDKGTKEVSIGKNIVEETTDRFKDITNAVENVLTEIDEVSTSIGAMDKYSKKVLESVTGIKKVIINTSSKTESVAAITEEQVAVSNEVANHASGLGKLSKDLQDNIKEFKI